MGILDIFQSYRTCRRFDQIIHQLAFGNFTNYLEDGRKKIQEAYSITEELKGKIGKKKLSAMELRIGEIDDDLDLAYHMGYLRA